MSGTDPLWIAVTGKGGAGKSVISGTLARVLARRGRKVLALDSDPMPGLTLSLGAEEPASPPLNDAAERYQEFRWRLKPGIGPVRAVQRFSTEAPDGIRLLTLGKADEHGLENIFGSTIAYHQVVNTIDRAKTFRDWALIGIDVSAKRPMWDCNSTALHMTVESGAIDIARLLLDAGADPNIRDDKYDATALGWAEFFDRSDFAELIRAKGGV